MQVRWPFLYSFLSIYQVFIILFLAVLSKAKSGICRWFFSSLQSLNHNFIVGLKRPKGDYAIKQRVLFFSVITY